MKNCLRNAVSPLTPRNYPNMREDAYLLFQFCLFDFPTGRKILSQHMHILERNAKRGKILLTVALIQGLMADICFHGISMPIIYFPSKWDWRLRSRRRLALSLSAENQWWRRIPWKSIYFPHRRDALEEKTSGGICRQLFYVLLKPLVNLRVFEKSQLVIDGIRTVNPLDTFKISQAIFFDGIMIPSCIKNWVEIK